MYYRIYSYIWKMIREISTQRIPVKLWIKDNEEGALQQALDLANLRIAYSHIAIMPDSHQGYGMPIGGILATEVAVVPNAVGVDIGCGMCSLRTSLTDISLKDLRNMMSQIRKLIPVGFKHHSTKQDDKWMPPLEEELPIVIQEFESATFQVGTLGGGNHFIEIQKGSDGFIWIMIHSGSRNIGYTVAGHYHKLAIEETYNRGDRDVPRDLSYFLKDSANFDLYLKEMNYCMAFALNNRKLMMERVKEAFIDIIPDVEFSNFINKPHNFAAYETHFGNEVMVHRKGATRAEKGEWGMIPGSQGTNSYLVIGKGNPESFNSCSHGAGRVMSRAKARKTLDLKSEMARLQERGIIHAIRNRSDLDEAPSSYKDIKEVMALQEDLVEIKVELTPLAVIKG